MPRSAPSPGRRRRLRRLLRRKQLLLETELGEIADAAGIKHAVEMITFVLPHAREKSAYLARAMAAVLVVPGVTQMRVERRQRAPRWCRTYPAPGCAAPAYRTRSPPRPRAANADRPSVILYESPYDCALCQAGVAPVSLDLYFAAKIPEFLKPDIV